MRLLRRRHGGGTRDLRLWLWLWGRHERQRLAGQGLVRIVPDRLLARRAAHHLHGHLDVDGAGDATAVVLVRLDAGAHEENEVEQQQDGDECEQRLLECNLEAHGVGCLVVVVGVGVVCVVGRVLELPQPLGVVSHERGKEADGQGGKEPDDEVQRYVCARVNAAVVLGGPDRDELGCLPDDGYPGLDGARSRQQTCGFLMGGQELSLPLSRRKRPQSLSPKSRNSSLMRNTEPA